MRKFGLLLLLSLAVPFFTSGVAAQLQTGSQSRISTNRQTTLKQQLEFGLRARRPGEFKFIAKVVSMVEQGELPLKLVNSTFQWARKKRPYQYPYFEKALRIRAARQGIHVPASGLID